MVYFKFYNWILCLNKNWIKKKEFSGLIFHWILSHSIKNHWFFSSNVHRCQAWLDTDVHFFSCHVGPSTSFDRLQSVVFSQSVVFFGNQLIWFKFLSSINDLKTNFSKTQMHLSRNSRNCKSIVFKTRSLRGALLTKTALDYNIFLRFV